MIDRLAYPRAVIYRAQSSDNDKRGVSPNVYVNLLLGVLFLYFVSIFGS